MREIAEFRVDEQFAPMLFGEREGKRLGDFVRKVELQTTDPRYKRVGELQLELKHSVGKPFFYGWSLTYKYGAREIKAASLLRLKITSTFEPAGEECGTKYDESMACPHCGAGAEQVLVCFWGDIGQGDLIVVDQRGLIPGAGLATEAHFLHPQARRRGAALGQRELRLGFVAQVQLGQLPPRGGEQVKVCRVGQHRDARQHLLQIRRIRGPVIG